METTPPTTSPLTRLFSLALSLHGQHDETNESTQQSSSSSLLTLRQLVSVHESLCKAISLSSSVSLFPLDALTVDSNSSLFDLNDMMKYYFQNHSIQDQTVAKDILVIMNHEDTKKKEPQILLLLQYVLYSSPFIVKVEDNEDSIKIWKGLATIVLPFLLQQQQEQKQQQQSLISKELREALLDAVFTLTCTSVASLSLSSPYLTMIQQECTSVSNIFNYNNHVITCRILVRLYKNQLSSSSSSCTRAEKKEENQNQQILLMMIHQWMHDKVYKSISNLVLKDDNDDNKEEEEETPKASSLQQKKLIASFDTILRPLITDILPILYPTTTTMTTTMTTTTSSKNEQEQSQKETNQLWILLMNLVQTNLDHAKKDDNDKTGMDSQQQDTNTTLTILMSLTSILCTILPSLVSQELPCLNEEKGPQRQRPLYTSLVWDLIYYCLSRGQSETTLQTGARGQSSSNIGGGGTSSSSSSMTTSSSLTGSVVMENLSLEAKHQLLRRRGLYLLRILVEQPKQEPKQEPKQSKHSKKQKKQKKIPPEAPVAPKATVTTPPVGLISVQDWMKYCLCFEALEMENEQHLVDQVWDTVTELCHLAATTAAAAASFKDENNVQQQVQSQLPFMTWNWLSAMLSRVLLSESPTVRKLGLYRFLNGHTGIDVNMEEEEEEEQQQGQGQQETEQNEESETPKTESKDTNDGNGNNNNNNQTKKKQSKIFKKQPKKKHSIKGGNNNNKNKKTKKEPLPKAPLHLISTDFVLDIVLPSYDSLYMSIGINMQFEQDGKIQSDNLEPRLATFLGNYLISIMKRIPTDHSEEEEQQQQHKLQAFVRGLFQESTVCQLRNRTLVEVYRAITKVLKSSTTSSLSLLHEGQSKQQQQQQQLLQLPMTNDLLELVVQSFQSLFAKGSVVQSFRRGLLNALAVILSHSSMNKGSAKVDPKTLLKVLALYPSSWFANLQHHQKEDQESSFRGSDDITKKDMEELSIFEALQQWCMQVGDSPSWASTVGAACASAYVSGQLVPTLVHWDPTTGISETERSMGCAVTLLCTLSSSTTSSKTAGELLWPAIHKGVSYAPGAIIVDSSWPKADHVTRALVLLESGCRLGVLSGLGNGELVIDQNQQMMPPPPNIEGLLQKAVNFILQHIKALTTWEAVDGNATERRGGATRSDATQRVSSKFASLISQMEALHEAYPSSMATSNAVDSMLQLSIDTVTSGTADSVEVVKYTALAYASLSVGADPEVLPSSELIQACRTLLNLEFRGDATISKSDRQAARSILQYAKWGTLSRLLPVLLEKKSLEASQGLCSDLFEVALDSVHATPADALLPLFECVLISAQHWLPQDEDESKVDDRSFTDHLEKIISTLFTLMKDTPSSRTSMYMLNEICSLIFRPRLLLDEAARLEEECEAPAPIRDAFHKLIETAGTQRNHISTCVVSWIAVGWLGMKNDISKDSTSTCGIGAIPYSKVIANLLLHKEAKLDESSVHQDPMSAATSGKIQLPPETNALSIVRGFLLLFISKLPDANNGLDPKVLSKLLHPIIFSLLDDVCLKQVKGSMLTTGSLGYCQKMRAWQSLCVLSRFVTNDIADSVCKKIFSSLDQTLHGQIRYFVEIFTIQCARLHPEVFGGMFVREIRQTNLTLQHVSSLMIIGGNLIVGRYQVDFFRQFEGENVNGVRLHEVLAGTLPWLSSTQGFSRAIAQIIVHKVIPLVVDVTSKESEGGESDWFLKSMYFFLDENPEMKRLRTKQSKVFETYDVDRMCTPEGILGTPVDEGDEANPLHVVESMKRCLEQVYEEAHEKDVPTWKTVQEMLDAEGSGVVSAISDGNDQEESTLVNFQRKIIPLDSLNLAMEETRQQSLRNATGRKKQELIVCASLIDKVPNIAGLARTAEIFAADRLIVPDKKQTKMDNFKSISVSAGEWIQIDECTESNLLSWLRQKKENGYTIVGVEQTSSSVSIEKLAFPEKTVLLLGKEKEGIPVEFLQAVDICVEIPQFGIIRSLNVHVSGSVAIWEYTKQMLTAKK